MVDTTGTSTYTYDDLYRLTGATYPNADVQSYTFDAQGNRLTKVHNSVTTNYSYDDADQMTAAGGVTYGGGSGFGGVGGGMGDFLPSGVSGSLVCGDID